METMNAVTDGTIRDEYVKFIGNIIKWNLLAVWAM